MKIINQTVILIFLLISFNLLIAEISNIQYEGTWARSHTYDWGFAKQGNDLYIGDKARVEKYQIQDDGALEFISRFEECNGLIDDIHVVGDTLYLATSAMPYSTLYVIDISSGDYQVQQVFEQLSLARLDGTFFSNDRYVFYISTYFSQTSYYYDRENHTLNEWEIESFSHQDILGDLYIDIDWDYEVEGGRIRFQDISDINNPDLIYLSEPIYHTLTTAITALNETTLAIIDGSGDVPVPDLIFWDITNLATPIEISRISLECDDSFYNPLKPIIVEDDYLYLSTHSSTGNRFLYDISDLENPILNSAWQTNDKYSYDYSFKSIAHENYIYTKSNAAGILKYNTNQLPITEPEDVYGEQYSSALWGEFDGERVILYNGDKVIAKEYPDDVGTIIYQDSLMENANATFVCNDSLVIVKIIDAYSGLMDLKLVETTTGQLMNSYDAIPYCRQQFYVAPYFYLCYQSNIKVYEIDNEWNMNLVTNLYPGASGDPSLSINEFFENEIWVYSTNKVFIYDTSDFSILRQFNNTDLAPTGDTPWLRYVDDSGYFSVQYNYGKNARIYFMDQDDQLELIQALNFDVYTSLEKIEDDIFSGRTSLPAKFYHFSEAGISEPYAEYNFMNNTFMFDVDEENKRIYAFKSGSYESFTYDYFVDVDENEVTLPGCSLKNFPNPFNPNTVISFQTSDFSGQNMDESASIEIYNIKGQRVKSFKDLQGKKAVVWHGRDDNGKAVGSGVYFYQLQRGEEVLASRKMTLLK